MLITYCNVSTCEILARVQPVLNKILLYHQNQGNEKCMNSLPVIRTLQSLTFEQFNLLKLTGHVMH